MLKHVKHPQDLEDDGIFAPALTVGTGNLFTERALPAVGGIASVSVIHPMGVLLKLFSSLCEQQLPSPSKDLERMLQEWKGNLAQLLAV
eukprot:s2769_g12.t1